MEEFSGELLEMLPPLFLLFFLAFSPGIMRFLQKRKLKKGGDLKKKPLREKTEEEKEPAESLSRRNEGPLPGRILRDSREGFSGSAVNEPLRKLEALPPLQKAFVWSEILGKPGGKGMK